MSTFYNYYKYSLLAIWVVFASETTHAFQLVETPYYQTLEEYSAIRPQLTRRALNYSIFEKGNRSDAPIFSPTARTFMGIGLHFFDIDLSLNLPVNKSEWNRNIDYQGKFTSRSWGLEGMWQRYSNLESSGPGQEYMRHTLISGYYLFNHRKFSIRAITNQNERQLRSAGSAILFTTLSRLDVQYPYELQPEPFSQGISGYNHWLWAIMPGYSYNFVKEGWIVNGTVAYGLGHYWEEYGTTTGTEEDINLHGIYQLAGFLGIDRASHFAGLRIDYRRFRSGSDEIVNRFSYYSVRLSFGLRIFEKGVMTKSVTDIFSKNR